MDVDRETLKALSSDRRAEILKVLGKRRYLPSELSRKMNIAPSTVVEHLKILEQAGLIERQETGHKWIYYSLTSKGAEIVQPSIPLRLVLAVVLGSGLLLFSFAQIFPLTVMNAAPPVPAVTGEGQVFGGEPKIIVSERGSSGLAGGFADSGLTAEQVSAVAAVPGVKDVVPQMYYRDPAVGAWVAIGINPVQAGLIDAGTSVAEGRVLGPADGTALVAGTNFAKQHDLQVGDSFPVGGVPVTVVGVLKESGKGEIDNNFLIPLHTLQQITGEQTVSVVEVIPVEPGQAASVAERIGKAEAGVDVLLAAKRAAHPAETTAIPVQAVSPL